MFTDRCVTLVLVRIGVAVTKKNDSSKVEIMRETMKESPPPATGISMRQWFAGLAIANPVLMKDIPESQRITEAVRLADELILALVPARVPTRNSMRAPTRRELRAWEKKIENDKIAKPGDTCPASPRAMLGNHPNLIIPPPPADALPALPPFKLPLQGLCSGMGRLPSDSRYSSIKDKDVDGRVDCDDE